MTVYTAPYGNPQSTVKPRISSVAFVASIFTLLAIAFVVVLCRSYLRLRSSTPVAIDDALLWLAVLTLAGATGTVYYAHNFFYVQMYVAADMPSQAPQAARAGAIGPNAIDLHQRAVQFQCQQAASMLIWSTIYLVKFSFLVFFHKLVYKILEFYIWWWIVCVIVAGSGIVSVPFCWYVCTGLMQCGLLDPAKRQTRLMIYLKVTTALDIATDILILSIPLLIISGIKAKKTQKLIAGSILSLSIFMIVIALIRITLNEVKLSSNHSFSDAAWLFFWQFVEAAVAILMATMTAFRSLYIQAVSKSNKKRPGCRRRPQRPGDSKGEASDSAATVTTTERGLTSEDAQSKEVVKRLPSLRSLGGLHSFGGLSSSGGGGGGLRTPANLEAGHHQQGQHDLEIQRSRGDDDGNDIDMKNIRPFL